MTRSISDFIQEQETGTHINDTDDMIQSYVECASACSLVNYYAEQAALMSFASENGIVMESDGNIFTKIGGGIKSAWTSFIKFIKGIVSKIAGFFSSKKLEKAEKDLASLDQNQEITVERRILYPYLTLAACKKIGSLTDKVKDYDPSTSGGLSALVGPINDTNKQIDEVTKGTNAALVKEYLSDYTTKYEVTKDGRIIMTIGQFRELIKELNGNKIKNETAKVQHEIDQFEKRVNNMLAEARADVDDKTKDPNKVNGTFIGIHHEGEEDNDARQAGKDYANKKLDKISERSKAVINALGTTTKHLSRLYDETIKQYQTVASDVTSMLKKSAPGGTSNNKIGRPGDVTLSVESAYYV